MPEGGGGGGGSGTVARSSLAIQSRYASCIHLKMRTMLGRSVNGSLGRDRSASGSGDGKESERLLLCGWA